MSQYRDDRAATSLRIEALEASVAERDAELARREAELAEREEEIFHLQRELELAGGSAPRRVRSVNAAWASRIVGVASGLAIVSAAVGASLVCPPVTPAAPVSIFMRPAAAPIHADPFVSGPVDWAAEPSEAPATPAPVVVGEAPDSTPRDFKVWRARDSEEEMHLPRRELEARVWSGHGSVREILALRRICASEEDRGCQKRVNAELTRELQRLRAGSH